VVLDNPQQAWRPGLFVSVSVATDQHRVPVAVPNGAIQALNGKPHVFVRVPGGFSPRAVEPGHSDGKLTEIRGGLAAGVQVAAAGSFMVRSELEKRSADRD
jgi:cobalt-zinc-cadmium efflux system membrane fusion protein